MGWPASLLIGVLVSAFGAIYGYVVAVAAADWQKVSGSEGAAGYFVVLCAFLALIAGFVVGLLSSRYLGGPGWLGFFTGLGWSALSMGGGITILGAMAWLSAGREPLVAGQPLDLMIELSVPARLQDEVGKASAERPYIILFGDRIGVQGELDTTRGRVSNGRWILPGRVEIHNASSERLLGAALRAVPEQYFDLPLRAKPHLMPGWSDWLAYPHLGNRNPPPADDAFALRFRVVPRGPLPSDQ